MVGVLSACATTQSLQQVAQRNQEESSRLEGAGRLRDALERWKIILTIDPQYPGASQKKTEIEAKIKEQSNRHIAAGKELLQRREKQGAQREFLAALRLDPGNREALEQLYQSEQQLGEQTAYARPLRKGGVEAKSQPGQSGDAKSPPPEETEEEEETGEEVSFAEAAEMFRRGDYLAAIDAFSRVLAQQPGLREAVEYQKLAYYNQGVAYMGKENYGEALKMFERLRRIQPDFKRLPHYIQTAREKLADQHYLAGIRQYKEKKLKEAIEEWDQALALNPKLENARRSKERARGLLKSLQEIK
jgi:tetratricopeptide (TPR) repeat protein